MISPHWQLFADWCAARGLEPMPTNPTVIAEFMASAPAAESVRIKRVQAIRRAHRDAGLPLALPTAEPDSAWRVGEGWLTLEETLARAPVAGWITGLAGRRDAFLAVLVGQLGYTREKARSVTPLDVSVRPDGGLAIAGDPVPYGEDPASCPACAARRWLKIVEIYDDHGRSSARSYLATYKPDPDGEHECSSQEPVTGLGERSLLPPIDRYGWLGEWAPLSGRAVSAILAFRQDAAAAPVVGERSAPDETDVGEAREDFQRASMAELAELQDKMESRAAKALKESNAAIASTMELLNRVRSH